MISTIGNIFLKIKIFDPLYIFYIVNAVKQSKYVNLNKNLIFDYRTQNIKMLKQLYNNCENWLFYKVFYQEVVHIYGIV